MKAARLHEYQRSLEVEELDEQRITGPNDVIVRIGGAGLCRTDLHIQEGQWAEKSGVELRATLGLPAAEDSPAFLLPDGRAPDRAGLDRYLRITRLIRVSLEGNAGLCRSLIETRYGGVQGVAA